MSNECIIERTDFSQSRLVTGAKSANRFYEDENVRLTALKRLCNEELDIRPDNHEVREELHKTEQELRALQTGWQNSSLRARLTKSAEQKDAKAVNVGGIERRLVTSAPAGESLLQAEPVTDSKGSQKKLVGYAAVFSKNSLNLGGFVEQIAPGAFTDALKISDVRGLINHDSNQVLGRSSSKTLRLYQDGTGLLFYCDLISGDGLSESITNRIQRRDITGCSFSFTVAKDRWQFAQRPGEIDLRTIEKVDKLYDVGPVTYPAYNDTTVSVLVEQKRSAANTGGYKGYPSYDAYVKDVCDEFDEFMAAQRDRKKEIERQCLHAGRIINRCKAQIEESKT